MSYALKPLAPEHAVAAAEIHAEGQPGTFLTSLGGAFLRALYTEMAISPHCFGFVAADGDEVIGVITGTTDSSQVFKDLILRRWFKLALPVAGALLRRPRLIGNVVQTLLYPAQTKLEPGEAEWLYIGTRASRRGEGIGQALFDALVAEMRRRKVRVMGCIVDDANVVANRFHERNGLRPVRAMVMYGRPMHWLELPLTTKGEADGNASAT
jgi:ribosomal protein S18 acetylase RimI-like enzyme